LDKNTASPQGQAQFSSRSEQKEFKMGSASGMTGTKKVHGGFDMAWRSWTDAKDDTAPQRHIFEPERARPWPDAPPAAAHIALDPRPTVLVAADSHASAQLGGWAERAGLRCVGQIALDALADRLALMVGVDLILVDLRGADAGSALDQRAARMLAARPGLDRARLAILTDLAGLDAVVARIDSPDVELLCDPQPADIVTLLVMAALAAEAQGKDVCFHDATRDGEAARIDRLSEEVRRLAATIERLTREQDEARGGSAVMDTRDGFRAATAMAEGEPAGDGVRSAVGGHLTAAGRAPTPVEIRALLRARRLREQYLPADLFADPAWDMMLDLMAARLAGQRVSVSSLCIAAAVPPTTALRWIRQLTDRGVFARIDDPADGRRVFIELTEDAARALSSWTMAVRKNGGLFAGETRH
jgi:DNA-binding MarR family transcriptional regulator